MGKVALVVDDAPFIRAEIKEILEEQYIYKKYKVNTLNFNSLDTFRYVE